MEKSAVNINKRRKEDAIALAFLIYDIYKEEQENARVKSEKDGEAKHSNNKSK